MQRFEGPLQDLWSMDRDSPIHRLTWDWWWWLVMLEPEKVKGGKQLMVLWSSKDTRNIDVNFQPWKSEGRANVGEQGSVLSGMVASWWWDGEKMWEPIRLQSCRMAVINGTKELWKNCDSGSAGAIIPLLEDDLSMGLDSKSEKFWLNLKSSEQSGGPSFKIEMTPWHQAVSTLRTAGSEYGGGLGYEINRLHGAKAKALVDGVESDGTAYFQRVRVQAPAVPWYWGMLHFSDGSYLDWFLPHISLSMTRKSDRPWPMRHIGHISMSQGGIWHDRKRQRSETFNRCSVSMIPSDNTEGDGGHSPQAPLPIFEVALENGRTSIKLRAKAKARAHFRFDQPTRAGMISHLTYNEYPLELEKIIIEDEKGRRTLSQWEWVMGNGEHSWGLLH